jgi:hypothetical protein
MYIFRLKNATTIGHVQVFIPGAGGDTFRVGIYRGWLVRNGSGTITLCGQSASTSTTLPVGSSYATAAITAVSGQNLSFNANEYITVGFHTAGSSTVYTKMTGLSDEKIAYIANFTGVSAGFTASLTSAHISTVLTDRLCFELF